MSEKFVPLHVHSHYSLLKALPKIPELVAAAKAQGCTALALTDIDNLYGAIEFYKECKSAGIKPIIGLDAKMEGGARKLLYAADQSGYKTAGARTKSHPPTRKAHPLRGDAGRALARACYSRPQRSYNSRRKFIISSPTTGARGGCAR